MDAPTTTSKPRTSLFFPPAAGGRHKDTGGFYVVVGVSYARVELYNTPLQTSVISLQGLTAEDRGSGGGVLDTHAWP